MAEKLSKDLHSSVVDQRAELNAKTTQVEKSLNRDVAKLGAVIQNLNDKVVAPLDGHNINMGQIVK
jgi:hypothetical protein